MIYGTRFQKDSKDMSEYTIPVKSYNWLTDILILKTFLYYGFCLNVRNEFCRQQYICAMPYNLHINVRILQCQHNCANIINLITKLKCYFI